MTRPADRFVAAALDHALADSTLWTSEAWMAFNFVADYAKHLEAEAGGADRQSEQRIQCPRCPALMPPGKFCKGNPPDDPCPMRSV